MVCGLRHANQANYLHHPSILSSHNLLSSQGHGGKKDSPRNDSMRFKVCEPSELSELSPLPSRLNLFNSQAREGDIEGKKTQSNRPGRPEERWYALAH